MGLVWTTSQRLVVASQNTRSPQSQAREAAPSQICQRHSTQYIVPSLHRLAAAATASMAACLSWNAACSGPGAAASCRTLSSTVTVLQPIQRVWRMREAPHVPLLSKQLKGEK